MQTRNSFHDLSAARLLASVFGVLAGLGGITHAIGEILQGSVAPRALMFESWTQGPIATSMDGDPALSIIPNLLVTGLLTLIVSFAVIVWAAMYVQRKQGGWILIVLSVIMLLVGGGVGPPVIGVLAGIAGTTVNRPLTWWREHFSPTLRRFLAQLWPWVFGITLLNGLFLFIGSIILIYTVEINDANLFLNSFYFAVLSLIVATLTAVAHDAEDSEQMIATGVTRLSIHQGS